MALAPDSCYRGLQALSWAWCPLPVVSPQVGPRGGVLHFLRICGSTLGTVGKGIWRLRQLEAGWKRPHYGLRLLHLYKVRELRAWHPSGMVLSSVSVLTCVCIYMCVLYTCILYLYACVYVCVLACVDVYLCIYFVCMSV